VAGDPEPLEGIAAADAHLGRPVPLPALPLPLARWVEVHAHDDGAVEVEWNLDDTREGAAGRLALWVGAHPAPEQLPRETPVEPITLSGLQIEHRSAALEEAQPSLRPVHELRWESEGLHLRLTGQGPWRLDDLLALASSIVI
jgi:hypothetical protein